MTCYYAYKFLILIKLIGLQGSFFGAPNRFSVFVSADGVALVSLPGDVAEEVYEAVVSEVQDKVSKGSNKDKKVFHNHSKYQRLRGEIFTYFVLTCFTLLKFYNKVRKGHSMSAKNFKCAC